MSEFIHLNNPENVKKWCEKLNTNEKDLRSVISMIGNQVSSVKLMLELNKKTTAPHMQR